MSSLENIIDAEETMSWVEQQSAATAEWGARRRGRKERWEIDKAREALSSPVGFQTSSYILNLYFVMFMNMNQNVDPTSG